MSSTVAICSVAPGESISYGSGRVMCGRSNCPGFTGMACGFSDCRVRVEDITREVNDTTMERLRVQDAERKAYRERRREERGR